MTTRPRSTQRGCAFDCVPELQWVEYMHLNAEFAVQSSDHDPAVARFSIGALPNKPLIPILEYIARLGALDYVAHFGYRNPNGLSVIRSIGNANRFLPSPAERGQPTSCTRRSSSRTQ